MGLYVRMAVYFAAAWLAGQGVGVHDTETGDYTVNLDSLAAAITGLLGFIGTFIVSRIAKRKGGKT